MIRICVVLVFTVLGSFSSAYAAGFPNPTNTVNAEFQHSIEAKLYIKYDGPMELQPVSLSFDCSAQQDWKLYHGYLYMTNPAPYKVTEKKLESQVKIEKDLRGFDGLIFLSANGTKVSQAVFPSRTYSHYVKHNEQKCTVEWTDRGGEVHSKNYSYVRDTSWPERVAADGGTDIFSDSPVATNKRTFSNLVDLWLKYDAESGGFTVDDHE